MYCLMRFSFLSRFACACGLACLVLDAWLIVYCFVYWYPVSPLFHSFVHSTPHAAGETTRNKTKKTHTALLRKRGACTGDLNPASDSEPVPSIPPDTLGPSDATVKARTQRCVVDVCVVVVDVSGRLQRQTVEACIKTASDA